MAPFGVVFRPKSAQMELGIGLWGRLFTGSGEGYSQEVRGVIDMGFRENWEVNHRDTEAQRRGRKRKDIRGMNLVGFRPRSYSPTEVSAVRGDVSELTIIGAPAFPPFGCSH